MLIIGEPDTSFPSIRIFGLPHHVQEVFKYIAKVMRPIDDGKVLIVLFLLRRGVNFCIASWKP